MRNTAFTLLLISLVGTPLTSAMAAPAPSASPAAKASAAPKPAGTTAPGAPAPPAPPPGPNGPIAVFVDGKKVKFDVQPVMAEGSVFVPLRGVFQTMKATIDFDQKTNTITADREGVRIQVRIGDRFAKVNGENVVMEKPAGLLQKRAFVPLRFLSEQLGFDVDWNPAKAVVNIKSNK